MHRLFTALAQLLFVAVALGASPAWADCPVGTNGPSCEFSDAITCSGNGVAQFNGTCSCNVGIVGTSCNQCGPNFFNYPTCTFCQAATTCSGNGTCTGQGACVCNIGFVGPSCATPVDPCGDGTLDVGEACDDGGLVSGDGCSATCDVEPLVLGPVVPGLAGGLNTLTASNVATGATVYFLRGTAGSTPVPGCPGVLAPIGAPVVVGTGVGASGAASLVVNVPAASAGKTARLVAVDLSTCRASLRVTKTF